MTGVVHDTINCKRKPWTDLNFEAMTQTCSKGVGGFNKLCRPHPIYYKRLSWWMVLESAVISRMCLKNYNESDSLFCFSRLFITTIPLKMYQNNKYRIQVKLIPKKCICLSSFSKLRITFTQGFRFQNIILQSSIPEVTNGLKNKNFQLKRQISMLMPVWSLASLNVKSLNIICFCNILREF